MLPGDLMSLVARHTRRLLALALLLGSSSPAWSQTIDQVVPAEGAWGTVVSIQGEDLKGQGKKPRVFLTRAGSKKKTRLKVHSATDQLVVAELRKGPAGTYDVHVRPKGKAFTEVVAPDAFEIKAPEELTLETAATEPGQEIEIVGRFFGTRKGKVFVGGRKAAVLSWEAEPVGPADGDPPDRIRFRVPKGLFDGQHVVKVVSKSGAGLASQGLLIEESGVPIKGKPRAAALIDGALFETKDVSHDVGPDDLRVTGHFPAPAGGGAPAALSVRLVFPTGATEGTPTTLTQQDLTAFITFDRPVAGDEETLERFVSQDAEVTFLHESKILKGTFSATLVSETTEEEIPLVAGVFVSKPLGTLPELLVPTDVDWSVSVSELGIGELLEVSWDMPGVDPELVSCTVSVPKDDFLSPSVIANTPTGSVDLLLSNGGSYTVWLQVFHLGEMVFADTAAVTVTGMTVDIQYPSDSLVAGDLAVTARVHLAEFEFSLVAKVAGVEAPLLPTSGVDYEGTVPVEGVIADEYELIVEAEDIHGAVARDRHVLGWGEPPEMDIAAPAYTELGTPLLPVAIDCLDASDGPCTVTLEVWGPGLGSYTEIGQFQDSFDGTVDLSAYDGEDLFCRLRARNSVGLSTEFETLVFVDGSPLLTQPLGRSAGQVLDFDESTDRRLVVDWVFNGIFEIGQAGGLFVEDTTTGDVTEVPMPQFLGVRSPQYPYCHLTPTGVVFAATDAGADPFSSELFEWRNGELIALTDNPVMAPLGFDRLSQVAGDWLLFGTQGDELWRLHFPTGDLVQITSDGQGGDLSANGDVMYSTEDNPQSRANLFRIDAQGSATQLTFDDDVDNVAPRTDGTLVAYTKQNGGTPGEAIALLEDGTEEILRDYTTGTNSTVKEESDYRVSDGWVAFTRLGTVAQREVWVRDPSGVITKVTPGLAVDSRLEALSPTGEIIINQHPRRTLWRDDSLIDLSASFTDHAGPRWVDGAWRLTLGNTVFSIP
jgi:hypothetical protein